MACGITPCGRVDATAAGCRKAVAAAGALTFAAAGVAAIVVGAMYGWTATVYAVQFALTVTV